MPEPRPDPQVPENRPSATDGLLSILAGVGLFALAAKSHKVALRSMPRAKLEAAKQIIAKSALKQVEAIASHPTFRSISKAFKGHGTVSPGHWDQILREVDVSQLNIIQDLNMVLQLSPQDVKLRGAITQEILTKADREIPQLAKGRYQRLTIDDLPHVLAGSKHQEAVERVIGQGGSNLDRLALQMGVSRERLGKLRVDPWLFIDPSNSKKMYNLSRLNPMRLVDKIERVTVGGIPLFRMRTDQKGQKFGTAMFGNTFKDGQETTNPILKLLTGGKQDKGDVAIVGGVAWSRRSSRDPFALLEGPHNKLGEKAFTLSSDARQGQHFYTHHASKEMADEVLYGVEGKPVSDWDKAKRFLGIDVGTRGGYSRGQHGTVIDDLLREPFEGESKRAWAMKHDPTGLIGSVSADSIMANKLGDIGAKTPLAEAGFSRLFLTSSDPLIGAMNWANNMVSRPLYLMSKFGINIRPGKTPVGTLAKTAGLAASAYFGIEALKYADYALWDMPSKAAKYAVGGAEYARQTLLEGTGTAGAIESVEGETPGLITSPLSKALRVGGLLAAGALVGAKYGSPKLFSKFLKSATNPEATGVMRGIYGTVGHYAQSIAEKKGLGTKALGGLILGTGAGGLIGLASSAGNLTASREDVAERFQGDRKVPYRASSGWMLGRDPFSGGRIRYHRESVYNTLGTPYKDIGVYGSEGNKWAYGSWLPTLQNWGGMRRLLNPYFAEDRNYNTRPYPVTSGHFGEFPIFGPMLEGTVGSLLKPARYRNPYEAGPGPAGAGGSTGGSFIAGTGGGYESLSNINSMSQGAAEGYLSGSYAGVAGFRGFGSEKLKHMGFEAGPMVPMHANMPNDAGQMLSMQMRAIEEFVGLRGFQMQMIRENLLGNAYPSMKRPVLASSGKMTSSARSYYDVEPGGLLGLTELPRRFLLRPTKQPEVNFIPNSLPRFLPGTLSDFERDRTWPIDLSRGDPYTKIPQGEARLPGPGYEALHKLHGGMAYSMIDNFIVLADVAPFSQAYRITKQEVERVIMQGNLSPEWIRKYQIAVEQAEKRARFRTYHSRRFGGEQPVTIKEVKSPTEFTTYEHPETVYQIGGTNIDKRSEVAMIAEFQRRGATVQQARAQAEAAKSHMYNFLKEREGKKIDISLTGQRPGYTEVEASSFIKEAKTLGVGGTTSDLRDQSMLGRAYTGAGKMVGEIGFVAGGIAGFAASLTKDFSVAQKGSLAAKIGGTVAGAIVGGIAGGWVENKFTGDFSATQHYNRFNKYGTAYADWNSPVDSFLRTWMHSAASTAVDYTPAYRGKQRQIEEYFDKLKYTKNKMLASRGLEPAELEPTMTGLDYTDLSARTPGVMKAIPSSERQYFQAFAGELDPKERLRILESVPDYMKSIYLAIWKNSQPKKTFENPELDHAYNEYVMPMINTPPDQRVSAFFENKAIPEASSGFWHPSVPTEAVKYKTIEALGGNPHLHGLYSTEGARIDAYQPDVANVAQQLAASFNSTASSEDFGLMQKFLRGQDQSADLYAAPSYMYMSSRGRIDISQDDRSRYINSFDELSRGKGVW